MLILAYGTIYAWVFTLGACIGSFLNVVIYRLPLNLNIAKGRSFCPRCNHTLQGRDLVPLVSFVLLRGRCRFCKAKISGRYFLVEALGGILAVICLKHFWLTPQAGLAFCVLMILLAITFIDLDIQEIPDSLNLILFLLGICGIFLFGEVSLSSRIIGFFEISLPMLLMNFVIKDSFGGGDIKLCAACGFLLGWQGMLIAAFIGILTGGIYGVYLLAGRKKGRKDHFAFGPFLALGIGISLLWGQDLWQLYLGLF
ncbi:MAG: prepilin peptidase [Anaerovoracaceae bacterium]